MTVLRVFKNMSRNHLSKKILLHDSLPMFMHYLLRYLLPTYLRKYTHKVTIIEKQIFTLAGRRIFHSIYSIYSSQKWPDTYISQIKYEYNLLATMVIDLAKKMVLCRLTTYVNVIFFFLPYWQKTIKTTRPQRPQRPCEKKGFKLCT